MAPGLQSILLNLLEIYPAIVTILLGRHVRCSANSWILMSFLPWKPPLPISKLEHFRPRMPSNEQVPQRIHYTRGRRQNTPVYRLFE